MDGGAQQDSGREGEEDGMRFVLAVVMLAGLLGCAKKPSVIMTADITAAKAGDCLTHAPDGRPIFGVCEGDSGYHHLMHTLWARPGQQTCEHLMENGETCYVMKPQNTTLCAKGRDAASEKAAQWMDKHVKAASSLDEITITAPVTIVPLKCVDGANNIIPCPSKEKQ